MRTEGTIVNSLHYLLNSHQKWHVLFCSTYGWRSGRKRRTNKEQHNNGQKSRSGKHLHLHKSKTHKTKIRYALEKRCSPSISNHQNRSIRDAKETWCVDTRVARPSLPHSRLWLSDSTGLPIGCQLHLSKTQPALFRHAAILCGDNLATGQCAARPTWPTNASQAPRGSTHLVTCGRDELTLLLSATMPIFQSWSFGSMQSNSAIQTKTSDATIFIQVQRWWRINPPTHSIFQ